jgi:hypothetical protein
MKRNITLTLAAFIFSCMLACESTENDVFESMITCQPPFAPSMKGYELYSWKTDGQWNYTLITGTNRNKVYDEIVSNDNIESVEWIKISVQNLASLKAVLLRVPANESVSWISSPTRVAGFSLPGTTTVMQIKRHCSARDVNLEIIK